MARKPYTVRELGSGRFIVTDESGGIVTDPTILVQLEFEQYPGQAYTVWLDTADNDSILPITDINIHLHNTRK